MLFADLLSLHLVTFLMFFILVSIYCVSALSLHIESTDSTIERIGRLKSATVQLPRYVLRYCFLAIADIRYPVEYSLYM